MWIGIFLFFFSLAPASSGASVPSLAVDLCNQTPLDRSQFTELANALTNTIVSATKNKEPFFHNSGGGLFDGNYDWHSSVHAHWALLSMGRVFNDQKLLDTLHSKLTRTALEKEQAYLQKNPGFELPYGQAWLLLLLKELEVQGQDAPSNLKEQLFERVISWLEMNQNKKDYLWQGSYQSWLMTYWLLKKVDAPEYENRLAQLDSKIKTLQLPIKYQQLDSYFVDAPSLLEVFSPTDSLKRTMSPQEQVSVLSNQYGKENNHTIGASITSLWPFAVAASQGDTAACRTVVDYINSFMQNQNLWSNKFTESHWIPQYVWILVWQLLGQP